MEHLEDPSPDDHKIIALLKSHVYGSGTSHKRGAFVALSAAMASIDTDTDGKLYSR